MANLSTMLESPTRNQVVERATSYPYSLPESSYVWVANRELELVDLHLERLAETLIRTDEGAVTSLGDYCDQIGIGVKCLEQVRTPVLAYGSNASVEALDRKFVESPQTSVVPVARARLHDLDVVYSAHFSRYGAIGAALQASSGTVANTFVVFVTDALLRELHASEPNYHYRRLIDVRVDIEHDVRLDTVHSYVSKHGCLVLDGEHVALAAVPAEDRHFPALFERDVLERVRRELAAEVEFETFVYENAVNQDVARRRTEVLRASARALDWPMGEVD